MNNLRLLVDIMGAGFETIITYFYMRAVFKDCKVNKNIEILSYFILMILMLIASINYLNTIILPIISFIFLILLSMIYEGRISLKIISNLILAILFILSEVIIVMIIIRLIDHDIRFFQENVVYYLQGVLVSKLLVFIVVKIIEYRMNNSYSLVHKKILIPLVLMPISSILVIYIVSEKAFIMTNAYVSLLTILIVLFLIVANIAIFYLIEKQLKREEEKIKSEFFNQQLENQKKHFGELAENQRRTNRTIHDTKNQLLAILGYIKDNQNQLAIESMDILCDNITGDSNVVRTGNVAIDSLLNAKINKIDELGINLETSIFIEQSNQVEDIDLCILLGNAMDNAIEACEKISSENEKKIRFRIIQVEEYLSIEISNSILTKAKIEKSRISTTKKDRLFHGFGLESIKEIVEKYNGHINYEQEENTFILKILLQNSIISPILQK